MGGRHSVGGYSSPSRSASNQQNFYAQQRYGGGRQSEADQMMQAKRRMAAQRERELRNYHQEQQYNKSASPSTAYVNNTNSVRPSRGDGFEQIRSIDES